MQWRALTHFMTKGGILLVVAFLCGALITTTASAKGRTRFLELQPMGGFSYVHLRAFDATDFDTSSKLSRAELAELNAELALRGVQSPKTGHGPSAGLAAQIKLWIFILAARYEGTKTPGFALHTVGGDLGMRLGQRVSLYGRGGLGYTIVKGLPAIIKTQGIALTTSGGVDIQLTQAISVGIGCDADLLFLSQALDTKTALGPSATSTIDVAELEGSVIGFLVRPQLHLTWHM